VELDKEKKGIVLHVGFGWWKRLRTSWERAENELRTSWERAENVRELGKRVEPNRKIWREWASSTWRELSGALQEHLIWVGKVVQLLEFSIFANSWRYLREDQPSILNYLTAERRWSKKSNPWYILWEREKGIQNNAPLFNETEYQEFRVLSRKIRERNKIC
jgi:hypothetical protein